MWLGRGQQKGSFLLKASLEVSFEEVTCAQRPKQGMRYNLQRPGSCKGELGLVAAQERGQCGGGVQGSRGQVHKELGAVTAQGWRTHRPPWLFCL